MGFSNIAKLFKSSQKELIISNTPTLILRGTPISLRTNLNDDVIVGELLNEEIHTETFGLITILLSNGRKFRTEGYASII